MAHTPWGRAARRAGEAYQAAQWRDSGLNGPAGANGRSAWPDFPANQFGQFAAGEKQPFDHALIQILHEGVCPDALTPPKTGHPDATG